MRIVANSELDMIRGLCSVWEGGGGEDHVLAISDVHAFSHLVMNGVN